MHKSKHKTRHRELSAREIDALNERGYSVNCIVTNQLHTDQRVERTKPKRARRRTTTTGLMARTRTTVER